MKALKHWSRCAVYALLDPFSAVGLLPRKLNAWHTRLGLSLDLF